MVDLLRRVRSWLTAPVRVPVRAVDDAGVDLGDADDPDGRVVVGFDGSLSDDELPPIRYVLGVDPGDPAALLPEWRERLRARRLTFFATPMEVSCAFCPEPGTEEIFVGWANPPGATDGPPTAQFARVCIDHVGHSRFPRSDRPVDEL